VLLLLVLFVVPRAGGDVGGPEISAADCNGTDRSDAAALERCLTVRPGDLALMEDLAVVYERSSRWDRAEEIYRAALSVDPFDGDLHVRLGSVLLQRGDVDGARAQAGAAAALQPGRPGPIELMRRGRPAAPLPAGVPQ
jgi:Flp pilus assembly protein TadD